MKLGNDVAIKVPYDGQYQISIQNVTATGITLNYRPEQASSYSILDNETFTAEDTRLVRLNSSTDPNFKYTATGGDADVYLDFVGNS